MAIDEKSLHQFGDSHFIKAYTATFAAASTRSDGVNLDGKAPVLLCVSSGYSQTQGMTLRVQVSTGGVTYFPLWSAGTAYTVAVQKSQAVRVDPQVFWGVNYIRLHSTEPRGTASTQHASSIGIIARVI